MSLLTHRAHLRRRTISVTSALLAVSFVLFVLTIMVGSTVIAAPDVVKSLLGIGDNPGIDFIVRGLRLPTAVQALVAGMAFGVSGAIFQQLLANPLASPDFVGISAGASVGAVVLIVFFHAGLFAVTLGAMVGAIASAALIYFLAWRDGITGFRFILIGIGVAQFMYAIVWFTISRARLYDAREAMRWLVGSVGQTGWNMTITLGIVLMFLLPTVMILTRQFRVLELGEPAAKALGIEVERTRIALMGIAIVLIAIGTATVGPLAFVALVAGPVAARLLGAAGQSFLAAGLAGAIIVLAADLVAQHLLPASLPTGVITGAVGAPYLMWILITANRKGRGE